MLNVLLALLLSTQSSSKVRVACGGETEPLFEFSTNIGKVSFSPCTEARKSAGARRRQTHERIALIDKRTFIVEYYVTSSDFARIPLVYPTGEAHYEAEITIYEVSAGEKKKVAGPLGGQWTAEGCLEDDPVTIVENWLKEANKR